MRRLPVLHVAGWRHQLQINRVRWQTVLARRAEALASVDFMAVASGVPAARTDRHAGDLERVRPLPNSTGGNHADAPPIWARPRHALPDLADALRGAAQNSLCRRKLPGLGDLIEEGWQCGYQSTAVWPKMRRCYCLTDQAPRDWLVVDHYMLDAVWERELRAITDKLMVIDDLANRSYDCDLWLDQNLQEPGRDVGLIPETSAMLTGPKYARLRPQFAAARENLRVRDGRVSRLLVFFGGADADGETLKALSAIKMLGRPDIVIDVVLARRTAPAGNRSSCRDLPNVALHCQVENMAELMAAADLFVVYGTSSLGALLSGDTCFIDRNR